MLKNYSFAKGARPLQPSVRMRSLQEGLAPTMVARLDQNFSDTYGSAESTGPLAMDPAGGADVIAGLPRGVQRIVPAHLSR